MAVKKIVIIVIAECSLIPAEKMDNFVRNIPKGGAPVIAKKPVKKITLVIGKALIVPLTLAILVELYFRNIFPADRKREDFIRE